MGWFSGSSKDSSAMKVTDSGDTLKTERISSRDKEHSHDIVKVEKTTGVVKQISVGEKFGRSRNR